MRKLFYILLFFVSCNTEVVYSQIVITTLINLNTSTADGTSVNATITTTVDKFYIVVVGSSKATTPDLPTATKTAGLTFTQIATATTATHRITAFYGLATATDGNTLSGLFGGVVQTGTIMGLYEFSGITQTGTNGVDAIVQSATNTGISANPSITMSALTGTRNAVMAFFVNDANPFGGTAETDWTLGLDGGYATPNSGIFQMSRLTTTDNTPTVTASSSDWAGIAIEIKSGARRRIIID